MESTKYSLINVRLRHHVYPEEIWSTTTPDHIQGQWSNSFCENLKCLHYLIGWYRLLYVKIIKFQYIALIRTLKYIVYIVQLFSEFLPQMNTTFEVWPTVGKPLWVLDKSLIIQSAPLVSQVWFYAVRLHQDHEMAPLSLMFAPTHAYPDVGSYRGATYWGCQSACGQLHCRIGTTGQDSICNISGHYPILLFGRFYSL